MAIEIERKFLVRNDSWRKNARGTWCRQGYLTLNTRRLIRVRVIGPKGYITVKGKKDALSRYEFEYPIPSAEANEMLETLCMKPLIEKTRYKVHYKGTLWEIDEFAGANEGLIIAEVELAHTDEKIHIPPWAGNEVTDDPRYYNFNLVRYPYSRWPDRVAPA